MRANLFLLITTTLIVGCAEPDSTPVGPIPVAEPDPVTASGPSEPTCSDAEQVVAELRRDACRFVRSDGLRASQSWGIAPRFLADAELEPETAELVGSVTSDVDWTFVDGALEAEPAAGLSVAWTAFDSTGNVLDADPTDLSTFMGGWSVEQEVPFSAMIDDDSLVNTWQISFDALGPRSDLLGLVRGEPIVVRASLRQLLPLFGLEPVDPDSRADLGALAGLLDVGLAGEFQAERQVDGFDVVYRGSAPMARVEMIQAGEGPLLALDTVEVVHSQMQVEVSLIEAPVHDGFDCTDGEWDIEIAADRFTASLGPSTNGEFECFPR